MADSLVKEVAPGIMATSYKLSDTTLQKERVIIETRSNVTYERAFLEKQLIDIQAQKDAYDAARDAELAEVQGLLDECDELGIVAKVEEVIKEVGGGLEEQIIP